VNARVAVLTPPGTGAIATVAVVGSDGWALLERLFRRVANKSLPSTPVQNAVWFGSLGEGPGDEVVVAVKEAEPELRIEIHCHGGRRVVRWVVEQFVSHGCEEVDWTDVESAAGFDQRARRLLTQAQTLRTASILLDQFQGAFVRSVEAILASPSLEGLADLAGRVTVGRHLVEPWRVAIAGPPNVGKSSLVNALAGFQRTVVAPVAGTTRDVVRVAVALDGWPVTLADTAGLRAPTDDIEAQGIERARDASAQSDLVLWIIDASAEVPVEPTDFERPPVRVLNKIDASAEWAADYPADLRVSALTGEGIDRLVSRIVQPLNAVPLHPGDGIPFTTELADAVAAAHALRATGKTDAARARLTKLLAHSSAS